MNDRRLSYNFKSYLGLDDSSPKINKGRDGPIEELKPKLVNGELVIGAAHNVLLFAPVNEKQSGRFGSLFVTNYKLSFVTDDQLFGACRQQNLLLGPHDVTLSMVASVFELSGVENDEYPSKWRRRHLRPSQAVSRKVQGLQILCKNMRVFSFGFKFSPAGQGKTIATSLLHHAFPKRHDLLFAYDYKEPYYSTLGDVNMFQRYNDWKREMERTNCQSWRISRANETTDGFFHGAGDALVVPSSVLDCQLSDAARHFRKGRVPIWVWSAPRGAALVRSGELFGGTGGSTGTPAHAPESVLLEAVRGAHPELSVPKVIPVVAPTLQNSYKKLTNICTPNTLTNFWEQDGPFFSALENTKWLRYVSECLRMSSDAADYLADNITVVLQEGDGMDYCAVVSSLIQLLLDSHSRTIKGFQSLIQKEWIALGHPFSDRLGHVSLEESDMTEGNRDMSPVFLLFLDCCWQLQKQFPSSFEFTEVYLTTLWDTAHNQLFDTFLFNSPRDRQLAVNKCLTLRPVWDWKEQFTENEIQYFYNPIYSPPSQHTHPPKSFVPPSAIRLPGLASPQKPNNDLRWLTPSPTHLKPNTSIQTMDIWQQCYLRWLPILNLPGSGDIQFLLNNIRVSREIRLLQEKISSNDINRRSNGAKDDDLSNNMVCAHPTTVSTFFPFVGNATGGGDPLALLTTSLLEPNQELDSQSILNAPD